MLQKKNSKQIYAEPFVSNDNKSCVFFHTWLLVRHPCLFFSFSLPIEISKYTQLIFFCELLRLILLLKKWIESVKSIQGHASSFMQYFFFPFLARLDMWTEYMKSKLMNYVGFSVHKLIILGVKNGGGEFLPLFFLVDKRKFH